MPILNIGVANKIATNLSPGGAMVCGNNDYSLAFTFDEEWEAYPLKTARFVYTLGGQLCYQERTFSGNEVAVPVLSNIREVYVGVYAGELHTTTPARILCNKSILCGGDVHDDPPEDVYLQILALIQAGMVSGPAGQDGETPYIGENGNWYIGDDDTNTPATGPQGPQGEKGATGAKGDKGDTGADGITPTIGENGNWWVGDKDTGTPAQGAGAQEIFLVTLNKNDDETYSPDYNYAKINNALSDGLVPILRYGNMFLNLARLSVSDCLFSGVDSGGNIVKVMIKATSSTAIITETEVADKSELDSALDTVSNYQYIAVLEENDDWDLGLAGVAVIDGNGNQVGIVGADEGFNTLATAYRQGKNVVAYNEDIGATIPCVLIDPLVGEAEVMMFALSEGFDGSVFSYIVALTSNGSAEMASGEVHTSDITINGTTHDGQSSTDFTATINSMIDAKIKALDATGVSY